MERLVKARKIHKCLVCNGLIRNGQIYKYIECRNPVYDNNDFNQIGIEYQKYRTHNFNCMPISWLFSIPELKVIFNTCRKGNHDYINEVVPTEWYNEDGSTDETGKIICKRCNEYKHN